MWKRIWAHGAVRKATYTIGVCVVAFVSLCWFFRIKSERDIMAYIGMAGECHPVWRDLAFGRVYEGQPVEETITITNPMFIIRHGRYVRLSYQEPFSFTGIEIVARDGRVISA